MICNSDDKCPLCGKGVTVLVIGTSGPKRYRCTHCRFENDHNGWNDWENAQEGRVWSIEARGYVKDDQR